MTAVRMSFRVPCFVQKLLLNTLRWIICTLPEKSALFLGARIGDLLRILTPKKVLILRDNLSKCDMVLDCRETPRNFERRVFRHFGMFGVEFLRMKILSDEMVREKFSLGGWTGIENLVKELERGKGAIVFSGHIGNWEMVIRRMALDLATCPNTVIRPIKNPVVHDFVVQHREVYGGGRSLLSTVGVRPLIRALSRGEVLNIVIDQNAMAEEGEFVPFFGRLACTYSTLAKLSLFLGTSVIPALSYRLPDGIHHAALFASPIPPILNLPKSEAIHKMTEQYSRFLEEAIRAHPEQWIWMHRRWKTVPP